MYRCARPYAKCTPFLSIGYNIDLFVVMVWRYHDTALELNASALKSDPSFRTVLFFFTNYTFFKAVMQFVLAHNIFQKKVQW